MLAGDDGLGEAMGFTANDDHPLELLLAVRVCHAETVYDATVSSEILEGQLACHHEVTGGQAAIHRQNHPRDRRRGV